MGVFDEASDLFTAYRATLHVAGRLYGGIPGDPKLIEGWIQAKVGANDEMIRQLWIRNLQEQGAEVNDRMTVEELHRAAESITAEKKTNVFKRDLNSGELYLEGRQVKAMLKEAVNILYVGQKWGKREAGHRDGAYQGKSAIAYFAERAFVVEDRIGLGVSEPSGIDPQIIHAMGRSALSYVEYVDDTRLTFHVEVLRDCLSRQQWAEIWQVGQREGLGARRSQSFGRFEIVEWVRLPAGSVKRGEVARSLMRAVV